MDADTTTQTIDLLRLKMARRLNGVLVDHFLIPLHHIRYETVQIIDCLNYSTIYPKFFDHVDVDPHVYYIFVIRGQLMNVPDKTRGDKAFTTTCPGVHRIIEDNVMVISVCSSHMYSMRLDKTPRCSFSCKVAEGLYNTWSLSSGSGGPRFPSLLSALNTMAIDQCQLDDFVMAVAAALLARVGRKPEIFSMDGRFATERLVLPRIKYPFYMVVQTKLGRTAVPVYQKDSAIIFGALNDTPNPEFIAPFRVERGVGYASWMDTKRKLIDRYANWKKSKAKRLHERIAGVDASRSGLESPIDSLSETSFDDPVTPSEYESLWREGFDKVEGGDDPDCAHITNAPNMRSISVSDFQRLAS